MCLLHLNLVSRIITYIFVIWLIIWKLPWAWWIVPALHRNFSNVRNGCCLNSRNPKMGFAFLKILQGELLMYSGTAACCLPWDCMLPVQECSNLPGESKEDTWQVLLEWDCFHQFMINQQTPLKKCSLGNFPRGNTH